MVFSGARVSKLSFSIFEDLFSFLESFIKENDPKQFVEADVKIHR